MKWVICGVSKDLQYLVVMPLPISPSRCPHLIHVLWRWMILLEDSSSRRLHNVENDLPGCYIMARMIMASVALDETNDYRIRLFPNVSINGHSTINTSGLAKGPNTGAINAIILLCQGEAWTLFPCILQETIVGNGVLRPCHQEVGEGQTPCSGY